MPRVLMQPPRMRSSAAMAPMAPTVRRATAVMRLRHCAWYVLKLPKPVRRNGTPRIARCRRSPWLGIVRVPRRPLPA